MYGIDAQCPAALLNWSGLTERADLSACEGEKKKKNNCCQKRSRPLPMRLTHSTSFFFLLKPCSRFAWLYASVCRLLRSSGRQGPLGGSADRGLGCTAGRQARCLPLGARRRSNAPGALRDAEEEAARKKKEREKYMIKKMGLRAWKERLAVKKLRKQRAEH